MNVVFFECEPWEKPILLKGLDGHAVRFVDAPLTEANAKEAEGADAVSVFIYSQVTHGVLARLPKLKLVATRSTGYDHIDLAACTQRGVTVCNVPEYGSETVAEHTFALLLDITRKIGESVERTRKGNFSLDGLRGDDLEGKTLAVIGTGRIGRHVIRIAQGFGLTVHAYDPKPDPLLAAQHRVEYKPWPDVLREADIVTLHVPLLPATTHLVNRETLKQFKKGAILLNTSRGGLVQTQALLEGLKTGVFSAIGLDVVEEERFVREERELALGAFDGAVDVKTALQTKVLLDDERVYVTPHNAFNSHQALQRILDTTLQNLQSHASGAARNALNTP